MKTKEKSTAKIQVPIVVGLGIHRRLKMAASERGVKLQSFAERCILLGIGEAIAEPVTPDQVKAKKGAKP